MAEYVSRLDDGDETKLRGLASPASSGDGSSNGTFFRAVLLVRRAKVHLKYTFILAGFLIIYLQTLIFVYVCLWLFVFSFEV